MAQGALVFRWGASVRGREHTALRIFGETAAFFDDLQSNHRIAAHQPYVSMNRDGGMWVLQGDTQQLAALREHADWQRMVLRVRQVVESYALEMYLGGTVLDLEDPMLIAAEVVDEMI